MKSTWPSGEDIYLKCGSPGVQFLAVMVKLVTDKCVFLVLDTLWGQ